MDMRNDLAHPGICVIFAVLILNFIDMEIKNRERLFKAIQTKIGDRPCPLCGKLSGFGVEIPEFQIIGFDRTSRGLNLGSSGSHEYIPCAAVICKNCGNVQMIALQVLMDDPDYLNSSLC